MPLAQLQVGEALDPVAEHEELAAVLAPLVRVVEVPDDHARRSLPRSAAPRSRSTAARPAAAARRASWRESSETACASGMPRSGWSQPYSRDAGRVAQHAAQQLVAQVAAHQAVAVVHPEPPALLLHRHRPVHRADPERLGQKRAQPEVVVAVQVDDLDPGLAEPLEGRQGAEKTARNGGPVFEPKVEQVPDDIQGGRPPGQRGQEGVEARSRAASASRRRRAEVGIREEHHRAGCMAAESMSAPRRAPIRRRRARDRRGQASSGLGARDATVAGARRV